MNEKQVQALLAALEAQRNSALNGLANVQAELAIANETIAALTKQLEEAKANAQQAIDVATEAIDVARQGTPVGAGA